MVQEVADDDVGSGHKVRGGGSLRDRQRSVVQNHRVECLVRMTSPGSPKYENMSVLRGTFSVKCT